MAAVARHSILSSVPFLNPEQTIEYSPNPISSSDTTRLRRRKPLREEWKYDSGRFLFNEGQRRAERSTRFDVRALEQEVSKCMDNARVLSTCLYLEGSKSRLLQMDLDDRRKVIVKIPYKPQPAHYATASEVATLSFLRTRGVPVPKVYGWSSNALQNKTGTEFIIMEKARGTAANVRLDDMDKSAAEKMVSGLVDVEKYLFGLPFGAFGSLYFKHDLPAHCRQPLFRGTPATSLRTDERYCIGPTSDSFFWATKTTEPTQDQGPWKTTSEYLESLGRCALQWMSKYSTLTSNKFPFNALFEDFTNPADQIGLIKQYLSIATILFSGTVDIALHKPALRHPGLTCHNIFMSRSITAVSCITNWRSATILPFAVASGFPRAFDSPHSLPGSYRSPRLSPNFNTAIEGIGCCDIKRVYLNQLLHYTYRIKTTLHNQVHAEVLDVLPVQLLQRLVHALRHPWTGVRNLVLLKAALIAVAQNWRAFSTGVTCPASMEFNAEVIEGLEQDEELLEDAEELILHVKKEIGILYGANDGAHSEDGLQGWVDHDKYEAAKRRNWELKEEWIAQAGNITEERQIESGWMFQDDADEKETGT